MESYSVFPLGENDVLREQVNVQLQEEWGNLSVAVHGELFDLAGCDGFVCLAGQTALGAVHYRRDGETYEVLSLYVLREHEGIGQALMRRAIDNARRNGAERLYLYTTNDNTRAIRFYQQMGMNLEAFDLNAVERSRKLKPCIPLTGCDGIPIRHELRFGMEL